MSSSSVIHIVIYIDGIPVASTLPSLFFKISLFDKI
uniref:Germination protein n=1 Tax=Myoviridae sp. ctWaE18 TaxID=2826662 RepID=A0A8S5MYX2_9CAUD|nr:MAG TPA: germination protein [Myoviridae sp. ctWaE18]